jgi:hypothetical protein
MGQRPRPNPRVPEPMVKSSHRSVFGYTVESDIPFNFLRSGEGEQTLRVDAASNTELQHEGSPVFQWTFKDRTTEVSAQLYRAGAEFHFWTSDTGWYRVDPAAGRITIPDNGDEARRELRLWGVPSMLCFVERGEIPLHASAVEIEGGAILFAAPGQFGKTTLALAFHRAGHRVLTEDLSCCRLSPTPVLIPGPASLRVRPDMFDGHAPEGTSVISIKPDRAFLALDSERRGTCVPVPIRGVVFLRKSEKEIRLEQVEATRALPDLWELSFRVRGHGGLARCFSALSGMASATTIWNLYRPLRMDVLSEVIALIVDLSSKQAGPRR